MPGPPEYPREFRACATARNHSHHPLLLLIQSTVNLRFQGQAVNTTLLQQSVQIRFSGTGLADLYPLLVLRQTDDGRDQHGQTMSLILKDAHQDEQPRPFQIATVFKIDTLQPALSRCKTNLERRSCRIMHVSTLPRCYCCTLLL